MSNDKSWQGFMQNALDSRAKNGLLKQEILFDRSHFPLLKYDGRELVSFSCNDYLGLGASKELANAVQNAAKSYGGGAGGSKFITGSCEVLKDIEELTAKLKNAEASVVFSSGYLANLGVISAFLGEEDIVFADKEVHASIIDGILLSKARLVRYAHLNHSHLRLLIAKHCDGGFKGRVCVVSETVFSMSGSVENTSSLVEIAKQYNALLILDDAHGFGVLPSQKINYELLVWTGTYSKATGLVGGYACGSAEVCRFLKNFARSQIYNTALPPPILQAILKSLQIIQYQGKALQAKLFGNIEEFCRLSTSTPKGAAILPIYFKNSEACRQKSLDLMQKGFFVKAIFAPTSQVPMLRLSFSAAHNLQQINQLCLALAS